MKNLLLFLFIVLIGISISSCDQPDCRHEDITSTLYAPTCSEKGYTHYYCKDCGLEFDADLVPPNGHTFDKEMIDPSCESEGYTLSKCSVCGYSEKSDFVGPLGHSFSETVIEPSCEKQGYTYAKCKNCDYYISYNFVKPLGHNCESTVTEPTCESEGYTEYKCKSCSYSYVSDYVESFGHDWSQKVVRPTTDDVGYTLNTCKICEREYRSDYTYYSQLFSGAKGEGRAVAYGIDVYNGDGTIDWNKVKASGIDFAIIKLGDSNQKDKMFETNYAEARAAGLDIGVYFYTYSLDIEGAKADAQLTLKYLNGKKLEYPVFYDMEDYKNYLPSDLSVDMRTDMIYTYANEIIAGGYYPGVYTNINWITNKFSEKEICNVFDVWIARYPSESNFSKYLDEYDDKYSIWQYSCTGVVDGISGEIDLNVSFKDYPAIMKKYHLNGY